ncbi:hypothetical protein H8356DRAFT_1355372 [Neocallimastix lanati (nom. inval.)]|nr:hypothetical protein H8356DRAFT_1355372 [Neocallimastix sp. JGI-2020a]
MQYLSYHFVRDLIFFEQSISNWYLSSILGYIISKNCSNGLSSSNFNSNTSPKILIIIFLKKYIYSTNENNQFFEITQRSLRFILFTYHNAFILYIYHLGVDVDHISYTPLYYEELLFSDLLNHHRGKNNNNTSSHRSNISSLPYPFNIDALGNVRSNSIQIDHSPHKYKIMKSGKEDSPLKVLPPRRRKKGNTVNCII